MLSLYEQYNFFRLICKCVTFHDFEIKDSISLQKIAFYCNNFFKDFLFVFFFGKLNKRKLNEMFSYSVIFLFEPCSGIRKQQIDLNLIN